MPDSRTRELEEAMATYQKLIASYTLTRERLIERRRGAADHVMVEIDQRLEVNARMIAALSRAVEMSREHLTLIYPREASENVEGAGGI